MWGYQSTNDIKSIESSVVEVAISPKQALENSLPRAIFGQDRTCMCSSYNGSTITFVYRYSGSQGDVVRVTVNLSCIGSELS